MIRNVMEVKVEEIIMTNPVTKNNICICVKLRFITTTRVVFSMKMLKECYQLHFNSLLEHKTVKQLYDHFMIIIWYMI